MSELADHLADLKAVVDLFTLRNFVETGIGYGGGLGVATDLGLTCYSCDVDAAYVARARARFPAATLFNGESEEFLRVVVPPLVLQDSATFFWLDAHFADEKHGKHPMWPLWRELTLLKELRDCRRDVIWCDDMQHVVDPLNPVNKLGEAIGIAVLGGRWEGETEHSIAEYVGLFAETHDAEFVGTTLRFTPKHA